MSNQATKDNGKVLIFALDTSRHRTEIGIFADKRPIGIFAVEAEKRSAGLHQEIELLFSKVGRRVTEVDCFAVIVGPGSFTGLRVGLATAKGLAAATDKPMVTMSSLEAMARLAGQSSCTCVLLEASRNEVYTQLFAVDTVKSVAALSAATSTTAAQAIENAAIKCRDFGNKLVFIGDDYTAEIEAIAAKHAATVRYDPYLTSASKEWIVKREGLAITALADYAYEAYFSGSTTTAEAVVPLYVKPSEAEVKLALGLIGRKF
ncbi:MAG: tRNA (adenosine(37)-N6)-threonylcarbamoyltransferase complex dimerization subunit type 1 TsaB [Acidobacteriota bacterium]|nr:tRNA (adenosine(37)-N6)-threonylcarbamoyltransferase complex dimerization subunit type 1 TsaB [Blastocatellia bacterium]MDW8411368.1 tRNA (adenosine(37)-N6)-threonylcarbamoyltransferase complex dimerization subunit type 1 TsaB [Acidobacteriota bacterium]